HGHRGEGGGRRGQSRGGRRLDRRLDATGARRRAGAAPRLRAGPGRRGQLRQRHGHGAAGAARGGGGARAVAGDRRVSSTMISGPRRKVALGLMKSEEADVTIEVMEAKYPDVQVHDFGTYWKIEGEGELRVEMDEISEALGRPLQLSQWLVIMATFVGRAHAGGDYFLVTSEMSYLEGDEAEASGPAAG